MSNTERESERGSGLTAFGRRSLPAMPGFVVMLGPGLVWMALAQGSGELVWWPRLVAKYGLAFLFLLAPACLLQFPVTFEIGRYTVLTGEGVFRGFFRLNRVFGIFLWVLFTISFFWFGAFASAGGTAIAALTEFPRGWSHEHQTLFWAQLSIVVFTLAIVLAKTVYRLIEWVMKIVAVVSLGGMMIACFHPDVRGVVGQFLYHLFVPDMRAMSAWRWDGGETDRLLTAIAFAGLGGFWTLFYSYWLKEKGAGMSAHMAHITGFRSGVAGIRMGTGALPADETRTPGRLARWYRYLSFETLVGIIGNLLTSLLTCLLAFGILYPKGLIPEKFDIAVVQAEFFANSWGQAGRLLFLFIAGAFLADTWLATVDGVARVHLDVITALWPRVAQRDVRPWYYGIVLLLAVITSVTMYWAPPGPLIVISAVIGFVGTVIYCIALLWINHVLLAGELAPGLKPGRWSRWAMLLATGCYMVLAAGYVYVRLWRG